MRAAPRLQAPAILSQQQQQQHLQAEGGAVLGSQSGLRLLGRQHPPQLRGCVHVAPQVAHGGPAARGGWVHGCRLQGGSWARPAGRPHSRPHARHCCGAGPWAAGPSKQAGHASGVGSKARQYACKEQGTCVSRNGRCAPVGHGPAAHQLQQRLLLGRDVGDGLPRECVRGRAKQSVGRMKQLISQIRAGMEVTAWMGGGAGLLAHASNGPPLRSRHVHVMPARSAAPHTSAQLHPTSAAGTQAPTWRTRSRPRLTSVPHALRASSQREYEALVLQAAGRAGSTASGRVGGWAGVGQERRRRRPCPQLQPLPAGRRRRRRHPRQAQRRWAGSAVQQPAGRQAPRRSSSRQQSARVPLFSAQAGERAGGLTAGRAAARAQRLRGKTGRCCGSASSRECIR